MSRRLFILFLAGLAVAFACGVCGAQPEEPKAQPGPPEKSAVARAPLAVEHEGGDPVGLKLVHQIKESVNVSSFFSLSGKDEKKVVLVVQTREEFADRPKIGSAYAVTWLYSAKDGSLRYFLQSTVGVVDAYSVDEAAQAVVSKTVRVVESYAYLLK